MKSMSGDGAVGFFQVGGDPEKCVKFAMAEQAVFSEGALGGVCFFCG